MATLGQYDWAFVIAGSLLICGAVALAIMTGKVILPTSNGATSGGSRSKHEYYTVMLRAKQFILLIQIGELLRIGMLLPSSNRAAEARYSGDAGKRRHRLHTTRLKLTGSTPDKLLAMTQDVETAASLLADAGVDLIAFHCTAVSTFNPAMERELKQRIEELLKTATATSAALIAAFRV